MANLACSLVFRPFAIRGDYSWIECCTFMHLRRSRLEVGELLGVRTLPRMETSELLKRRQKRMVRGYHSRVLQFIIALARYASARLP